ncbi:hypothetical protein [Natrinema sp. 1APR25-10V2]|uniref:hypothetical protein n=1 Tax=Natrinema sp. 1APR25-10V2 TaxID=2951081 RepID=UPI0028742611|nr:hypothetical protein [Natrinema sp. 1APR25-10V2]MDS0476203.1 MSCRAMM family adhesin SdrC [Natrinema sp. 1APR25-10V2]
MGVGSNIRNLGRFLAEWEEEGATVHNVELVECGDSKSESTAEIELAVSTSSSDRQPEGLTPAEIEIGSDGRLRLVLESAAPVVPTFDHNLELVPTAATVDADVGITVTLSADSTDMRGSEESEWTPASVVVSDETDDEVVVDRDRSVPPFRDPERLAEVYESCETFTEMSEALEMDVTAETVRRYMIDFGIHEPNSYRTDGNEDDEAEVDSETDAGAESSASNADDDRSETVSETEGERDQSSSVVLTDGLGLPDDVTVETLVETVSRANTIYEVKQKFGLDRDETLDLLRRLEIDEFVVGRVADEHERDAGHEEIFDRLRQVSATEA